MTLFLAINCMAETAYVNADSGLRLRAAPSTDADIKDKLSNGTEIKIIGDNYGNDGKWLKIKVGDEFGYVHGDYINNENPIDGMTYLGNWHITAYTYTGNVCANGNSPTPGYTVACNSLDFGTHIYIEGVGERIVEDRGPKWLGTNWADIFCSTYNECIVWGSQYKNVYLLED